MGVLVWITLLLGPVLLFYISNWSENKRIQRLRDKAQREVDTQKRSKQHRQTNTQQAAVTNETRVAVRYETSEQGQISTVDKPTNPELEVATERSLQAFTIFEGLPPYEKQVREEEVKRMMSEWEKRRAHDAFAELSKRKEEQDRELTRHRTYTNSFSDRWEKHNRYTDEPYSETNPISDFSQLALPDSESKTLLQNRIQELRITAKSDFPGYVEWEPRPMDFGEPCFDHLLPEAERKPLLQAARDKRTSVDTYQGLKLLLPDHFHRCFWLEKDVRYLQGVGKIDVYYQRIRPSVHYSRSYLAKAIVVQGHEWRAVLQVADYMFRKGMIKCSTEQIQKEMKALHWCLKFWYRALCFDEPINFHYERAQISSSQPRSGVRNSTVPIWLQDSEMNYKLFQQDNAKAV